MNTRHTPPIDDLIAPCAVEGATFRDPAPIRPRPPRRWPDRLLYVGCLLVMVFVGASASCNARAADLCDWSEPGRDRYTGEVPAAIDHYQDIPAATRARLAARMASRDFDEVVTITADSITGRHRYAPDLWAMHYGTGRICMTTTRAGLRGDHYGLAYTEGEHTIVVPNDCGNVSRATRLTEAAQHVENEPGGPIGFADAQPLPMFTGPEIQTAIGAFTAAYGAAMFFGSPTVVALPGIAPPLPDLPVWASLLVGVIGLAAFRRGAR